MSRLLPLCCLALGAILLAPRSAAAVDAGTRERLDDLVPRQLQVSVGRDYVWASVRVRVGPDDLGWADWSGFDRDGSGILERAERKSLVLHLRGVETEYVAVQVDGVPLRFPTFRFRWVGESDEDLALDARIELRFEGRQKLALQPGRHRFVLSDRPRKLDDVVPVRMSLVRGMRFRDARGGPRHELSERRLDTALTAFTPLLWGEFDVVRGAAPKP